MGDGTCTWIYLERMVFQTENVLISVTQLGKLDKRIL